jgi:hypothetical protein
MTNEDAGSVLNGSVQCVFEDPITVFRQGAKCIYVDVPDPLPRDWDAFAINEAAKAQFVLNMLSDSLKKPAIMSFAIVLSRAMVTRVERVVSLPAIPDIRRLAAQSYRLTTSVNPAVASRLYGIIDSVCRSHTEVFITINRFNSCLTRSTWSDRIIDAAICLESLIRSQQELRFKFALHLSFISTSTPQQRADTFELLTDLYDVRSGLVHGSDTTAKLQKVQNQWDGVLRITKEALLYYFSYLETVRPMDWSNHLKALVLGTEESIIGR